MDKFISMDNAIIRWVVRLGDIAILNFYFVICSLPLFTMGASWTALYSTTLKMVRNEREEGLTTSFFTAFKQEFKQATVIWLIMVGMGAFLAGVFRLVSEMNNVLLMYGLYFVAAMLGLVLLYVFPLLARFHNSTMNLLRNAVLMSIAHLPQTLLMVILIGLFALATVLPYVGLFVLMVWAFIGFGAIAYVCSYFFRTIFEKYE